jgi:hypothetical protein
VNLRWATFGASTIFAIFFTVVAVAPDVHAQRTNGRDTRGIARSYATAHGLPVRVLRLGPQRRRVQRVFVPITNQEEQDDFQRRFGSESGGVTMRYHADSNHLGLAQEPRDALFWGGINLRDTEWGHLGLFGGKGVTLGVHLGSEKLAHLRAWIEWQAGPNEQRYACGNCMEWLPNAEVAPGKALFHELGVNRSRDGPNMRAKLIHAANAHVDVVGVHVESVDEFNAMSEQELAGKRPASGVEDAVRAGE